MTDEEIGLVPQRGFTDEEIGLTQSAPIPGRMVPNENHTDAQQLANIRAAFAAPGSI